MHESFDQHATWTANAVEWVNNILQDPELFSGSDFINSIHSPHHCATFCLLDTELVKTLSTP